MKNNIRIKILTIVAFTLAMQSTSSLSYASTSTMAGIQLAGPALPAPKLPKNPPTPPSLTPSAWSRFLAV